MNSDTKEYPTESFSNRSIIINENSFIDKNTVVLSKQHYQYIEKVVLTKGLIIDRIEKLAQEITRDYYNLQDVVLIVVMKGAVMFGGILAEKITDILSNDITNSYSMTFSVEYVNIKSYQDDKSTGEVKIRMDEKVQRKIEGQHILIIEDIYDSGLSLFNFNNYLKDLKPNSVKSAVLVQKKNHQNLKFDYCIDYLGFLIPDSFVIGFGMDYNEEFRQLNHLCIINAEGIQKFKSSK